MSAPVSLPGATVPVVLPLAEALAPVPGGADRPSLRAEAAARVRLRLAELEEAQREAQREEWRPGSRVEVACATGRLMMQVEVLLGLLDLGGAR